ncbi:hypothetical protein IHE30_06795 [Mycetohabitans sp. B46]
MLTINAHHTEFEAQNTDAPTSPTRAPSSPERASPKPTSSLSKTGEFDAIRNKLKNNTKVDKALSDFAARARGYLVREKSVKVQSHGAGIVQVTIKGGPGGVRPPGTPLAKIRDMLTPPPKTQPEKHSDSEGGGIATYNMLIVKGGAKSGKVIGTKEGEPPQSPQKLAAAAPKQSAIINGGYFVHKSGLKIVQDGSEGKATEGDYGRPVGPTATRPDHVDVAPPWQNDYGQLLQDGEVGITSGPVLALNGRRAKLESNDGRLQYRNAEGKDNPLNKFAGALTHASERNERAAVSVRPELFVNPNDGTHRLSDKPGDLIMHTVTTTDGIRDLGLPIGGKGGLQDLTEIGADPTGIYKDADKGIGVSSFNVDGGGSTFLGVRDENGVVKQLAGSGQPGDTRPVANIIAAQPTLD